MALVWHVVGGEDTGGILVREGQDFKSDKLGRLAYGAEVEQLDVQDGRLNYRLLNGQGPETGWVSLLYKQKELLVGPAPKFSREPDTEGRLNVITTVEGKLGLFKLKVPPDCITVGDWREGVKNQTLMVDKTLAQWIGKIHIMRYFGPGQLGPNLPDDAPLPVDPIDAPETRMLVFMKAADSIQIMLVNGLKDDYSKGVGSVMSDCIPRRLCVNCVTTLDPALNAVHGGYEEKLDGSQVIFEKASKDEAPMKLFRDQGRTLVFGTYDGDASFAKILLESEDTAPSPEVAKWPSGSIQHIAFYYGGKAAAGDELFEDQDFPHNRRSVGEELTKQLQFTPEWLAASGLREGMKLFDGIDPNDLLQGQVGDCWLIAAMAGLAEFPEEVEALFKEKGEVNAGRYVVRLFDHTQGDWNDVTVDEFVPCAQKEWWELDGTPLFARPQGNEMWCIILEKAMAKLFSDYSQLIANTCSVAFRAFTGAQGNLLYQKQASGDAWIKWRLMDGSFKFQGCVGDQDYRQSSDDLFEKLRQNDEESYLMSVGCEVKTATEFRRPDGIMEGHAYTLLKVTEANGQRLLLLRNPWGNDCEWNGDWSDKSDKWDKNPEVKEQLRPTFQDDGLFWMCWEDFNRIWDQVNVCEKSMRKSTNEDLKSFVANLGEKAMERKRRHPREVMMKKISPVVRLKVKRGEDSAEDAEEPAAEVSQEKLLEALLRQIFDWLDKNKNGELELKEAIDGLHHVFHADNEQIKKGREVYEVLTGSDAHAKLSKEQFVQAGLSYKSSSSDSRVMEAMKRFNASNSLWAAIDAMKIADETGNFGKKEVGKVLKAAAVHVRKGQNDEFWEQAAAQLIFQHDEEPKDGKLSKTEFMKLLGDMTSLCKDETKPSCAGAAGQIRKVSDAVKKLKDLKRAETGLPSSFGEQDQVVSFDAPGPQGCLDDVAKGLLVLLDQLGEKLRSCLAGLQS